MLGKTLSHLLKRGKLSFIGKPFYTALVRTELMYVRWKDGVDLFENTPFVDENLTAIIKTFERPETVKRLVRSMKRLYPKLKIIVVDDSANPLVLEGVETIILPYDSGVSVGRQKALEAVKTPYVLLLDDDFVFYGETNLEPAIVIMDEYREIDIMGGEVLNLPSFKSVDYRQAKLHPTKERSVMPEGSSIAGIPVFDKVPNFYIARTEQLKLVGWDKRIKRLDHADFFTRAKGVLVTVFNHQFKVLHAQTPFNETYMKKRNDVDEDRKILYEKYYT